MHFFSHKTSGGVAALLFATLISSYAQPGVTAGANGTVHIVTNGGVTIITSVITNGGNFSYSSSSSSGGDATPPDLQKIIKQLTSDIAGPGGAAARVKNGAPPVPWLGVAADEASEALRAQLSLPDATGLVVRDITAKSPAALAGLQANDILLKLDDQLLVNAPQLQSLIRARKAGEEVALTILRKGKETKVKTKLAAHAPDAGGIADVQVINLGSFDLDLNKVFGQLHGGAAPVVIQKSFHSSVTNAAGGVDAAQMQKAVNEAVQRAMEQMQRQMEGTGQKKK